MASLADRKHPNFPIVPAPFWGGWLELILGGSVCSILGIRSSKTVDGVTHNYITQNGRVVRESYGTTVLEFIYSTDGKPFALNYSTDGGSTFRTFYYLLNMQGDVVGLYDIEQDSNGNIIGSGVIARYTYDAWGRILSITNNTGTAITSGTHIANVNPLRYRGYYYDAETGFYYLQSRYYDPTIGRFINADSYTDTGTGFLGYDMFAYCNNNPIMFSDTGGIAPDAAVDTDGDGVTDAYVYCYEYNDGKIKRTGRVYIFTTPIEKTDGSVIYPAGFDSSTDLMIENRLMQTDADGTPNPTLYAYQANKVSKDARGSIVDCMLDFAKFSEVEWGRTRQSLLTEWAGHHKWSISKRARNIDFDMKEENFTLEDYDDKAYTQIELKIKSVIDRIKSIGGTAK